MSEKKPLVLLIRDGWGVGDGSSGDAVAAAKTPAIDNLLKKYPFCRLAAAGEPVGVRAGGQGSSEVGHLNMGAGRIVEQEIVRADNMIKSGELFKAPVFVKAIENCIKNNSALHFLGLVQDQGVHAVQDHLHAFLEFAQKAGVKKIFVHFFTDGRDTPPKSALKFLEKLEHKMAQIGAGQVASVMGRYYAMDRGKNWDRTKIAFDALIYGKGLKAKSAKEAISSAYECAENKQNQDALPKTDEFISPTLITDKNDNCIGLICPGDSVIHANFRQDRAIQLTKAFCEPDFKEFDRGGPLPNVFFAGLTRYYDEFENAIIPPMNMENLMGQVLGDNGMWQLRIAEFQKYRHVTSFFNGKRIAPFAREDRVLVDSITIPENQQPEMSAYIVTDIALDAINKNINALREKAKATDKATLEASKTEPVKSDRFTRKYDLIIMNLANCDMVGHTGDFKAAVKAVEVVDECVKKICDAVLANDGVLMVTADHGNAEQMLDPKTNAPQTAHTINDVHFILVSNKAGYKLVEHGKLADIALTILDTLDIPAPSEMTASTLIKDKK